MKNQKLDLRSLGLAAAVGSFAGFFSSIFLWSLQMATELRQIHPWLIWTLPLMGLLIAMGDWLVKPRPQESVAGLAEEIRLSQVPIPFLALPRVLIGTLLTHLAGGSAGREGTAVLMGGVGGEWLSRIFSISANGRQILLMSGVAAGFGSAIGTPLAGLVFALEFCRTSWTSRKQALGALCMASLMGQVISWALATPHTQYPAPETIPFTLQSLGALLVASVVFALAVFLFLQSTQLLRRLFQHLLRNPLLRLPAVGLLLALMFSGLGHQQYAGLGIEEIQNSLHERVSFEAGWLKLLYTSLTLAGGFRGGEFTPLVFVGSHLGSGLSSWLHLPVSSLAALGFCALFSGAAKTPWTGAFLALELFSADLFLPALAVCTLSQILSGPRGIYQRDEAALLSSQKNKSAPDYPNGASSDIIEP